MEIRECNAPVLLVGALQSLLLVRESSKEKGVKSMNHQSLPHEESIAIGAVPALTERVTAPWTSGRTKATRERRAKQALLNRHGLTADIVYMAKPIVTGSTPRLITKGSPVKTYIDPNRMRKAVDRASNDHWRHDYTQG